MSPLPSSRPHSHRPRSSREGDPPSEDRLARMLGQPPYETPLRNLYNHYGLDFHGESHELSLEDFKRISEEAGLTDGRLIPAEVQVVESLCPYIVINDH